ncbi:allophanate hydrolase subunit 1 [Pseudonocardia sp. MCCB 268]|nr:allophanate hydrolase subunit 1 [Pseudonocardia cytotoxica]
MTCASCARRRQNRTRPSHGTRITKVKQTTTNGIDSTFDPIRKQVAEQQGCTLAEIAAIHCADSLRALPGFSAGAPDDGRSAAPSPVPRRWTHRGPRGPGRSSRAVAGRQAVVSAMAAPGGWAVLSDPAPGCSTSIDGPAGRVPPWRPDQVPRRRAAGIRRGRASRRGITVRG